MDSIYTEFQNPDPPLGTLSMGYRRSDLKKRIHGIVVWAIIQMCWELETARRNSKIELALNKH